MISSAMVTRDGSRYRIRFLTENGALLQGIFVDTAQQAADFLVNTQSRHCDYVAYMTREEVNMCRDREELARSYLAQKVKPRRNLSTWLWALVLFVWSVSLLCWIFG